MSAKSNTTRVIDTYNVRSVQIVLFILLTVSSFWPTLSGMIWEWYHMANSSHGFLIPFIVFFLIWRKKDEVKALITEGKSSFALIILVVGLLFYFIGRLVLSSSFRDLVSLFS